MELIKVGIFAIILVMIAGFLKSKNGNFSLVLSMAGVLFIGIITLNRLSDLFLGFEGLGNLFLFDGENIRLLMKLVGITYVCEFASQICMESGFGNLASQITMLGKITICGFALPLISELFQTMGAI